MPNAWQYYILKSVSRMVCLLPYRWVLVVGNHMGNLYYYIASRQRQLAIRQIQECLDISLSAAEKTIGSLCRKLGQTLLEVLYIPALTPARMEQYVTIENRQYLDQAMKNGQE